MVASADFEISTVCELSSLEYRYRLDKTSSRSRRVGRPRT